MCVCIGVCTREYMQLPMAVRRQCQTHEIFYVGARMELASSAISVHPLNHETTSPDLAFIFHFILGHYFLYSVLGIEFRKSQMLDKYSTSELPP